MTNDEPLAQLNVVNDRLMQELGDIVKDFIEESAKRIEKLEERVGDVEEDLARDMICLDERLLKLEARVAALEPPPCTWCKGKPGLIQCPSCGLVRRATSTPTNSTP